MKVFTESCNLINPNLGAGNFTPPPCWFSLNNSKTEKAVTLGFCGIE